MSEARNVIAVLVAMPEEVRPIARRLGPFRRETLGAFPLYRFSGKGMEVWLVRSGMGWKRASEAASLVRAHRPRLIVSAGFGGGVREGIATGDVVLAAGIMSLSGDVVTPVAHMDNSHMLAYLRESFPASHFGIVEGCVITCQGIWRKTEARRLLAEGLVHPVLDMETAAVAEAALGAGIPFLAVRSISDAWDEELLFSIEEITDRDLNISIRRVLAAIARDPRILPQMIRLARNGRKAGNNLALVLERIMGKG
jgi:adenosylhomocysteine nucleosidase